MVDLGMSPLCESFLRAEDLNRMEPFYPLRVYVCGDCFLVQLEEFVEPSEIFDEYAYFSSYSDAWLDHARCYVEAISARLSLDDTSNVLEVASNDGYLLQFFVEKGVPALGVEPARNVAEAAIEKGVPTRIEFFGDALATEMSADGYQADLVVANNVLAQVPDLNDFVSGLRRILSADGVITLEFPHLLQLLAQNQFDTIYHEHFSYFSLSTCMRILAAHGLEVFDVEELWTHGGSLRVFARQVGGSAASSDRVAEMIERELEAGLLDTSTYEGFGTLVEATKRQLLSLLIDARNAGKTVAAYGAPGKGNTLLNYCGIRTDLIEYACDRNPYKHGRFTPGTHIPIYPPEHLEETKPDYVVILPWNLKEEITKQLAYISDWGGRFVVPIPEVQLLPEVAS
jgi:SAM-dependent methyltransferase